jgi:hypothetical protein
MKKIIFLGLVVLVISCMNKTQDKAKISDNNTETLTAKAIKNQDDFILFWKSFRNSAINKDISNLKNITNFPLVAEGQDPYHPILNISESDFVITIDSFLNFDGLNDYPNYLAFIKDIPDIEKSQFYNQSNSMQDINGIIFKKSDNQWKLIRIVLNTQDLNEKIKKIKI